MRPERIKTGQHVGGMIEVTEGLSLGDIIVVSVKKAIPGSEIKPGTVAKGVVVRIRKNTRRVDGSYVRFDRNALVLVDGEGNPRGTRHEFATGFGEPGGRLATQAERRAKTRHRCL